MGVLDLEEWDLVLAKLHRYHANIQQECGIIVQTIRKEMKSELVPLAEEKANHGKIVKQAIRSIDIAHLTDDFVEDVMLQSKPLQGILMAIRLRQKETMESVKKNYWDVIKDLEPMKQDRPPKPKEEPKKEADKPAEPPKAEAPAPAPVTASA